MPRLHPLPLRSVLPTLAGLSDSLTRAVTTNNTGWVRDIFVQAEVQGIGLQPDWHHLLCALLQDNDIMFATLRQNGAAWAPDEARCVKEIFPNQWPAFAAKLGIGDNPDAISTPRDINLAVAMLERIRAHRALPQPEVTGSSLETAFNRKTAHDRFSGIKDFERMLTKDQPLFDAFIRAHRDRSYIAGGSQAFALLNAVSALHRNGYIPEWIRGGLETMKAAGVNFGWIQGETSKRHKAASICVVNDYLGRKEPGLAKILLDLNAVTALHFSLPVLGKKAEGQHAPYIEFYCQVYLEQINGGHYIPRRGAVGSYREELLTARLTRTGNGRTYSPVRAKDAPHSSFTALGHPRNRVVHPGNR